MRGIVITDEGKSLLAAALGGESAISFSRICTYNGEKNVMQNTSVSGITKSGNLCEVYGILDNSEVSEGYYIEGLGLFAQSGGEEILFGFCEENSDAFYVPAGSENSRTEVTLRIALTADCTDKIILRPNSDAYASAVQLYEEIARLDEAIDQKTAEKITALGSRVELLETILQSEISANSSVVGFTDLEGVEFNGIWNTQLNRIEF